MSGKRLVTAIARGIALVSGVSAASYAAYVVVTWIRYGRGQPSVRADLSLVHRFMLESEVAERHEIGVHAPAGITFDVLRDLDLQEAPLTRAIFTIRSLPARLRGARAVTFHRGILDETRALGWGLLDEIPGREIVMGAATQPWDPAPVFRAIPADEFAEFNEPGYAKIVWTLEAEPRGEHESIARTETRVRTTDPASRTRFRRYWSLLSPGILLIRYQALAMVKAESERRYHESAASTAHKARE
jgi:hypothetical protein